MNRDMLYPVVLHKGENGITATCIDFDFTVQSKNVPDVIRKVCDTMREMAIDMLDRFQELPDPTNEEIARFRYKTVVMLPCKLVED